MENLYPDFNEVSDLTDEEAVFYSECLAIVDSSFLFPHIKIMSPIWTIDLALETTVDSIKFISFGD